MIGAVRSGTHEGIEFIVGVYAVARLQLGAAEGIERRLSEENVKEMESGAIHAVAVKPA